MNQTDTRAVNTIHAPLMDRLPMVFPQDYDAIHPLKLSILTNMIEQMPDFDSGLRRRALANHTRQYGYLLALIHGRRDRRYDLDGQPVGSVIPEERAKTARLLATSTQRGQQRAVERRHQETKAARKTEYQHQQQKIAARKAALAAQQVVVESGAERKRRLARKAAARSKVQPRTEGPAVFARRPPAPPPQPTAENPPPD